MSTERPDRELYFDPGMNVVADELNGCVSRLVLAEQINEKVR